MCRLKYDINKSVAEMTIRQDAKVTTSTSSEVPPTPRTRRCISEDDREEGCTRRSEAPRQVEVVRKLIESVGVCSIVRTLNIIALNSQRQCASSKKSNAHLSVKALPQ